MVIVFVSANDCHRLVIKPIYDIMIREGYDCRWGNWGSPWGTGKGFTDKDVQFFVTSDHGIPAGLDRFPKPPPNSIPRAKGGLRNWTFAHWHGLHPCENAFVTPLWYGCLCPGEYQRTVLGDEDMASGKVPITGWAKLDKVSKPGIREQTIAKYSLGDLPYDKTVVYAPTGNWHWATSFDKSIHHILRVFEGLPYNLLIKLSFYTTGFKQLQSLKDYFKGSHPKHMRYINENDDITPIYSVSDVLISDGSSTAWEFIGLDKPTIHLTNMLDPVSSICPAIGRVAKGSVERGLFKQEVFCRYENSHTRKASMFQEYEECKLCGGTIKSTLEELRGKVVGAVENPNEFAETRRWWAHLWNQYVDGHCAERCVREIKRLAGI